VGAPRRAALAFLAAASPVLVVCQFAGGPAAGRVFAGVAVLFPLALIAAGISPSRRGRWTVRLLVVAAALFLLATAGLFLVTGSDGAGRIVLGTPVPLALVLVGFGLVPLVLFPVLYAATFDEGDR